MIDILLKGLIRQAENVENSNKKPEYVKIRAVLITPENHFTDMGIVGFAEFSDFYSNRAEDLKIKLRLQANNYVNQILPFRDDLLIQLIIISGDERVIREYVAIPLADGDPKSEGNSSKNVDLDGISALTFNEYEFQLLDKGFSKLKIKEVSYIANMCKVGMVIPRVLDMYSSFLKEIPGIDYKGTVMYNPVSNDKNYKSIVIPEGTKLINVPLYLQNSEEYGVYNHGLGCFYKQKRWWVYPLFNADIYDEHPLPLNIIRIPEDRLPDVQFSYFKTNEGITIISTGQGNHVDGTDITKQNKGIGNRLLLTDAVDGEGGLYFNQGRSLTQRADKLAEFQTSERKSGDDFLPLNTTPTSNIQKYASLNTGNEGEILEINWSNSDTGILEPGHPLRYQYIGETDQMVTRKGILLGFRTDYQIIDSMSMLMKRTTKLIIFIKKQEIYN